MNINIEIASQIPDQDLHDLILQNFGKIIGAGHELIAPQLPFDGNHILALDKEQKSVIITYDKYDGGNALLSGIATLEKLAASRELIYHLYPRLTERSPGNDDLLSIEKIKLVILAPQAVPGIEYLASHLPNVAVFNFQVLKVNDETGLLIESSKPKERAEFTNKQPIDHSPEFRTGSVNMSKEEERFFQAI